ncbi:MAG: acetylglutamate kinase [Fibrobacteria bacterium]|nr:acetylglutamate kinase [Fibrobacteria bacterium]
MSFPLTVIKIGGSIAEEDKCLSEIAASLCDVVQQGHKLALVHGGGKDINRNLLLLDEKPLFINGLRVTSPKTMDMVEMTLSGYVNKKLVGFINRQGGRAIGISGVDASMFVCEPVSENLGQVGSIVKVDPYPVEVLLNNGFLPVVSPISVDKECIHYNVNADEAARALASVLRVDKLVFLSDVAGVLDANNECIPELTPSIIEDLIQEGVVKDGMIPKLNSCVSVLKSGVGAVHICGWQGKACLTDQLLADKKNGTIIRL